MERAIEPLTSLLNKSEKAQTRVSVGTWQHGMLQENILAIRNALALMRRTIDPSDGCCAEVSRDASEDPSVLRKMIRKTESVRAKFAIGTSQHSLLTNRLMALRVAEAQLRAHCAP
jgi:hypothetical protein